MFNAYPLDRCICPLGFFFVLIYFFRGHFCIKHNTVVLPLSILCICCKTIAMVKLKVETIVLWI